MSSNTFSNLISLAGDDPDTYSIVPIFGNKKGDITSLNQLGILGELFSEFAFALHIQISPQKKGKKEKGPFYFSTITIILPSWYLFSGCPAFLKRRIVAFNPHFAFLVPQTSL